MKSPVKPGRSVSVDLSGYPQAYLVDALLKVLGENVIDARGGGRILDLGCGDGFLDQYLSVKGYAVLGVDADKSKIRAAKSRDPNGRYVVGSAYERLHDRHGTFHAVISVEVVEHLFDPHQFAETVSLLLEPGGVAVITTPYHGYVKNLLLAASGLMDQHFTALWPGGHIKFWSVKTISELLSRSGMIVEQVIRVGRVPPLARSMVVVARKPWDTQRGPTQPH